MASDIGLAAGAGSRRTDAELTSARRVARRHRGPGQIGYNGGVRQKAAKLRLELVELRGELEAHRTSGLCRRLRWAGRRR
jgi:hypothetical protein